MSAFEAQVTRQRPLARRAGGIRTLALGADRVAILGVALVAALLVVVTWNRWGDIWLDSGYDLVAGAKISHAQAPYLDYSYWYGPLGALAMGGVFEVFGIGIGPSIALGLVLAAAGIALTYAVARLLVGPFAAACVAVLAAVPALSNSNVSYVQPHTLAAPLGMILCLAAILMVARFARSGGRGWLVAIGVTVGLTALTRPESLGAAALAIGGWLLVRLWRARDRRAALVEAALVVGPALVVALGGYGAFLVAGSAHGDGLTLSELLHEDLFPRGLLRESVSVIYEQLAPRTAGSVASLAAKVVLYGTGIAALVGAGLALARRSAWRTAAAIALGLAAVGFVAVLVGRPDTLRHYLKYVFAWLPAGAILASGALLWTAGRSRTREWSTTGQVELLVALMLVGFTYSAYALYVPYPNPSFPQETAYAMPVVAAFLAWLHVRVVPRLGLGDAATMRAIGTGWIALLAIGCVGLLVHDARQETFSVRGSHGVMKATPTDGPVYQAAVDLIQRETKRSEPILLAPQMSALYVMTGRQDVLPQLSLLPGALDGPADERAAIRLMDDSGLRLAIVDRRPLTRYDHGTFGVEYDRLIGAWLRRDFNHIKTLRGPAVGGEQPRILDVWLRRTR